VRLAYLAKAASKRVSNLDSGEDVFEVDDMVKWEGGLTSCVWKGRRRGKGKVDVSPL